MRIVDFCTHKVFVYMIPACGNRKSIHKMLENCFYKCLFSIMLRANDIDVIKKVSLSIVTALNSTLILIQYTHKFILLNVKTAIKQSCLLS